MTDDIYNTAAQLRAARTPFVMATVVASYPPQSVRPGADRPIGRRRFRRSRSPRTRITRKAWKPGSRR